jgi:hypothetical protein
MKILLVIQVARTLGNFNIYIILMFYIKINQLLKEVENKDFFSKNDLFIKIKYNKICKTTNVKFNDSKPIWNEEFIFDINKDVFEFTLELLDKNSVNTERIINIYNVYTNYGEIRNEIIDHNINIDYGNLFYKKDIYINNLKDKMNELNVLNNALKGKLEQVQNIISL